MFVREPNWEYSANLVGSYLGELLLREPSWEYSSNCGEAIFGVQKASLNIFWEHLPYSANIASDWLEQSSPVDEEKIQIQMDDGVARFFTRFAGICFYLLTFWRRSLVSETQNEIEAS